MSSTPVAPLALAECEIHVWTTRLSAGPPPDPGSLSEEERARARALRSPARRERWLTARGRLRATLARYLDQPAGRVAIITGEHGKPELRSPDPAPLRFNLSHSGDLALYALARTREVGVDVERLRDGTDVVRLARRMLGEDVAGALERTDPGERPARFFAAWARHEARLKCLGTGLEGGHAAVRARPVTVLDLPIEPGYAAALALEGELALSPPEPVADELAAVPACGLQVLRWSAS